MSSFKKIQDSFLKYVQIFEIESKDQREAYEIKIAHSIRVMNLMQILNHSKDNDSGISQKLIKTIGIFHDIGRFEQYKQYQTFNDSISIDHGDLGFQVLKDNAFLESFSSIEQKIILKAVKNHNKIKIDDGLSEKEKYCAHMIRDADKLDIYHFVCPLYIQNPPNLNVKLKLMWPHEPYISNKVVDAFLARKPINFSFLKTVNDFKIAQLAWTFDFYFPKSLEILEEKKYIEIILNSLPKKYSKEINKLKDVLKCYISQERDKKCEKQYVF